MSHFKDDNTEAKRLQKLFPTEESMGLKINRVGGSYNKNWGPKSFGVPWPKVEHI